MGGKLEGKTERKREINRVREGERERKREIDRTREREMTQRVKKRYKARYKELDGMRENDFKTNLTDVVKWDTRLINQRHW